MSLTQLIDFFQEVNALKTTRRYSTCPDNVRDSTADHSWRLALMTIDVAKQFNLSVDVSYAIKLAICHDLGEYALEEDADSYDVARGRISKDAKQRAESEAVRSLADSYGRVDVYELWRDFEEQGTVEARYVKALDKLETQLHLINVGGVLDQEGAEHTAVYADEAVLAFPELLPFLGEVKSRLRREFDRRGLEWKAEFDRV